MMRRAKFPGSAFLNPAADPAAAAAGKGEWEVRPGGMLVQKRDPDSAAAAAAHAPTIRVKVKYAGAQHEIYLSSQSTFGELKKRMSERTGLHPGDQKVVYKDRERDSAAYLDTSGVKDGSKMLILEDPAAQAKRLLDARRHARTEKAAKSVSSVALEVDRLASQVAALEDNMKKGGRVTERDVLTLIELLMAQLIKLDGIVADGDTKQQRGIQVRRVQKYVEKLDLIKIKNSSAVGTLPTPKSNRQVKLERPAVAAATVMDMWETFDSLSSSSTTTTASSTATSAAPTPRLEWELF